MNRTAGVALLAGVLVVSALTPLGVSFVYSNSMEPTIDTGDGFIVLPADDADTGDVITFYSDERNEYVTHRVVEETDAGYVTQGDNNEVRDQEVGYAHVSPRDVEGRVLTVGGAPLTVPALGTVVAEASRYRGVLLALGLAAAIVGMGANGRSRDVTSAGSLFRQLLLVSVAVGVVAIVLSASTISLTITAEASSSPQTLTFEVDNRTTVNFTDTPTPYTHRIAAASGIEITDTASEDETLTLFVERVRDSESATVRFYHYPAVLPEGFVAALHGVHPLLAAVGTVGAAHVPVAGVYWLLVDSAEPLRPARTRPPRRWR